MVAVSNVLRCTASKPISTKEFFDAFASIWPSAARSRHSDILNVGLAISGGVDSMALAGLCSQLNHVDLNEFSELDKFGFERQQRLSFKAFIVDHGARIGSDEEAFGVKEQLQKIGISAQILKLQWPEGWRPAELSNFETVARTLRYQALGKACYSHRIQPLLTAHHEDDQVETVIMNLLRGARGMNLHGIRPSSNVPECFGIYGVNQSGGLSSQLKPNRQDGPNRKVLGAQNPASRTFEKGGSVQYPDIEPAPILMEKGGVRLYRPLLKFSKPRLIETSLHLKTLWFEDKTNMDPSLTTRNTIRHFYRNNFMPNALSKPSILQLAHKMEIKDRTEDSLTKTTYPEACVEEIDLKVGTLKVRFPKIASKDHEIEESRNLEKGRAARFLRTLIYFVTPNENVELSSLETACKNLFPDLFPECKLEPGQERARSFTTAFVQFERREVAISQSKSLWLEKHPEVKLDEKFLWVLSRQQHWLNSHMRPSITFPSRFVTSSEPRIANHPSVEDWSQWHLYDGRFWIRIFNNTSAIITIRPFKREDVTQLRNLPMSIYSSERKAKSLSKAAFDFIMKKHCPGSVRYTLPAIVATSGGKEEWKALPTFGIAVSGLREWGLDWEIRYKYVPDEANYSLQLNQGRLL